MLSFRKKPVFFYSHTKIDNNEFDTRFMSNLFSFPVVLNEKSKLYWTKQVPCPNIVLTSEHGYQAFKPYENDADAYFILGLCCPDSNCLECKGDKKQLSSNDAAKFGQGRFVPNVSQKKWLLHHGSVAPIVGRPKISKEGLKWLDNNCIDMMMELLRSKFTKDNDMGKLLLLFANKYDEILFTEHTKNDKIWADFKDGSGTNFLGKLLTIRLKELIDGKEIDELDYAYLEKPNKECVQYS